MIRHTWIYYPPREYRFDLYGPMFIFVLDLFNFGYVVYVYLNLHR